MDPLVFAAVLFAAACHAGWNAVLKLGLDPLATTTLMTGAGTLIAIPLLLLVGLPGTEAIPWLALSTLLHIAYYFGLTEAYRHGDMGQVYPIARGSAPLMTAFATSGFLAETISPVGWLGIIALVAGVLLLSSHGGRDLQKVDRRALGYAFFTAVTICAYTLVDGIGGRISGNVHGYAVMLFVWDGVAVLIWALLWRGPRILTVAAPYWKSGLFGGSLSLVAYWIAIWAMSVAPIAMVAALRESSVLFGAAIAVLWLKEPLRVARIIAAVMIVCGLALIKLN